jgi:hypothetical protein
MCHSAAGSFCSDSVNRPRYAAGEFEGTPAHTHTGITDVFFSRVTLLPERGVAIAVVSNSGSVRAGTASREAVAALLRMYGGATAPWVGVPWLQRTREANPCSLQCFAASTDTV